MIFMRNSISGLVCPGRSLYNKSDVVADTSNRSGEAEFHSLIKKEIKKSEKGIHLAHLVKEIKKSTIADQVGSGPRVTGLAC